MRMKVDVVNIFTGLIERVDVGKLELRVSVYGILIEDNAVLVSVHPKGKGKYNLPGGQLEKGELIQECLTREFMEETGLVVKLGKLLTVREGLVKFGVDGQAYQSILIFYEVERSGGELGVNVNHEDSAKCFFATINSETENKLMLVFKDLIKSNR